MMHRGLKNHNICAVKKIIMIDFKTFRSVCKYMQYGSDYHGSSDFYPTCRKKEMIPDGESWGICDENCCPYFDKKYNKVRVYIGDKFVGEMDGTRFFMDLRVTR